MGSKVKVSRLDCADGFAAKGRDGLLAKIGGNQ